MRLSQALLQPQHQIIKIKYFTAKVSALGDPQRPTRQDTYLRALKRHIPELDIYYGQFLQHTKKALIAAPPPPPKRWTTVYDIKEKGTDVNLAVHLLNDAWHNRYDCAVILSNDSDLAEAIRLVSNPHKKLMGLFIPFNCYPSIELSRLVHFRKQIRQPLLAVSQLPDPITGSNIHKPTSW